MGQLLTKTLFIYKMTEKEPNHRTRLILLIAGWVTHVSPTRCSTILNHVKHKILNKGDICFLIPALQLNLLHWVRSHVLMQPCFDVAHITGHFDLQSAREVMVGLFR